MHGTLRDSPLVIWTIGHSTRTFEEFTNLLGEHRIDRLVDVRHYPGSRRVPWTAKEPLAIGLKKRGIDYEHAEALGGFRKPLEGTANQGWRNSSFRGYADYMTSPMFVSAISGLLETAIGSRTAIMCAEAVPWKCHRSLLSDALIVRGVRVVHILGPGSSQEHRLTSFAKVDGLRVTYPEGGKVFKPPNRSRPSGE